MNAGQAFEQEVLDLIRSMGFQATLTRTTGDGGIDIIAVNNEPITKGKYIIQCKDWRNPVGEPVVRDLYGTMVSERANKGILITTSTFTTAALKFAEDKPLELLDGSKYQALKAKHSPSATVLAEAKEDWKIDGLLAQVSKNPRNILLRKQLADLYLVNSEFNIRLRAEEHYAYVIGNAPDRQISERLWDVYIQSFVNMAYVKCLRLNFEDAIQLLTSSLRSFDFGWRKIFIEKNLAVLLHWVGLHREAIPHYQAALVRMNRDNPAEFEEMIQSELELAYMGSEPESPYFTCLVLTDDPENDIDVLPLPIPSTYFDAPTRRVSQAQDECLDLAKQIIRLPEQVDVRWVNEKLSIEPSAQLLIELVNRAERLKVLSDAIVTDPATPSLAIPVFAKVSSFCDETATCLKDYGANQIEILKSATSGQDLETRILNTPVINERLVSLLSGVLDTLESDSWWDSFWKPILSGPKSWIEEAKARTRQAVGVNPGMTIVATTRQPPEVPKLPTTTKSGCFVATAVYGDPESPQVYTLRRWRDEALQPTTTGRAFIKFYYRFGPTWANVVRNSPPLMGAVRVCLDWFVDRLNTQRQ